MATNQKVDAPVPEFSEFQTTDDEDRDDDETNVEGDESTGGPTRNLEFDIDPL